MEWTGHQTNTITANMAPYRMALHIIKYNLTYNKVVK